MDENQAEFGRGRRTTSKVRLRQEVATVCDSPNLRGQSRSNDVTSIMFHEWQTYSTVSRSVEDRCLKGARHNSPNGTENFVVSPITLISVRLRSREDVVWSYMRSWNAQRNVSLRFSQITVEIYKISFYRTQQSMAPRRYRRGSTAR